MVSCYSRLAGLRDSQVCHEQSAKAETDVARKESLWGKQVGLLMLASSMPEQEGTIWEVEWKCGCIDVVKHNVALLLRKHLI